ncbi:MAG: alkaline phosphatase family protein [Mangrovibacterium sp.]
MINIENMRPEYIQRYYYNFQNGGFKRLVEEGALCSNTRMFINDQNICTSTASLFTGSYPSSHGIINSEWLNRVNNKKVDATNTPNYQTVGGDSNEGKRSAENLLSTTIGDELKLNSNGLSTVYSISANAETAIFSAGHAADGAFWMEKTTGNMISSSYYINEFPFWALSFNNQKKAKHALDKKWELLYLNPINYKASSEDGSNFEIGFEGKNTFPYDMQKIYSKTDNYSFLKNTPFMNNIITDFAIELFDKTRMGSDEHTDLLSINYSSLGGKFGPQSIENEDFYIRLDQDIARLTSHITKAIGDENILIVLSSVSAENYSAEYLNSLKIPNGYVKPDNIVALLRSYLNATFQQENWIQEVIDQEIYFNQELIKEKGVNFNEMLEKSAQLVNQFKGVDIAVPTSIFLQGDFANSRLKSMANSYNFQRSGDLCFSVQPNWQTNYRFQNKLYTTDNRICLLFWGKGVKKTNCSEETNAIDMVPTIFYLLGKAQPQGCQGKIIKQITN